MIAAAAIAALGVTILVLAATLKEAFHNLIAGLVKGLGIIFYIFSYIFFLIIDFLEITFKRIIGLKGTYSIEIDGTTTQSGDDLVLTVIKSKTIQNIFWALSIIALFLLVVSVIIAIIRSEYSWDKQGNSKGPIFGKAFKSIALYFTVPVACIFGVWGASQLLKALDQATSGGKQTYISSMVFSASVTQGGRLQSGTMWELLSKEYSDKDFGNGDLSKTAFAARFGAFVDGTTMQTALSGTNSAQVAEARAKVQQSIVEAFRTTRGMPDDPESGEAVGFTFNAAPSGKAYDFSKAHEDNPELWLIRQSVPESGANNKYVCSPYNIDLVYFYFGLVPGAGGVGWGYNHILSIICAFLIVKVLFDITCGVLKRAYELVVLYVISPPVVALMPLDDGSAYKSWVKSFISKTLMAFGGVLAINFFFMLVPVFNTISIFTTANGLTGAQAFFFGGGAISTLFDYLVRLLFVLAGAFSISSLSKMISGIIGAEDAAENGGQISGQISSMAGKVVGAAAAVGGAVLTGGASLATSAGSMIKNKIGSSGGGNSQAGDEGSGADVPEGGGDAGGGTPGPATPSSGGSGTPVSSGTGGNTSSSSGKLANFINNGATKGAVSKDDIAAANKASKDAAFKSKHPIKAGLKSFGEKHKGLRGLAKGGLGVLKFAGRLYGAALNNMTGGEFKKGFNDSYNLFRGNDIKKAKEKAKKESDSAAQAAQEAREEANYQNMLAAVNNSQIAANNTDSIAQSVSNIDTTTQNIDHTTSVINKHVNSQGRTMRSMAGDTAEIRERAEAIDVRQKTEKFIADKKKKIAAQDAASQGPTKKQKNRAHNAAVKVKIEHLKSDIDKLIKEQQNYELSYMNDPNYSIAEDEKLSDQIKKLESMKKKLEDSIKKRKKK